MRFLLIVLQDRLLWEYPRDTYPEPDGLGLGVSVPRLVNYVIAQSSAFRVPHAWCLVV